MRDFVKYDSSEALEEAIEAFQEESGEILFAGDERRMMINSLAYIAEMVMNEINYRANNNLIAYCDEETLLLKGEQRNVPRIQAEKASTIVRFSIEAEIGEPVKIEKGTRVTANGILFFQTTEDSEIPAGERTVEIKCEATQAGEEYNKIPVGEIKILTDSIPYITKISNTEESYGGCDIEGIEEYRNKVLDAPKAYNTAGAGPAYIKKVKEVDARITDVFLVNDETIIKIYFICENGNIPDGELVNKVTEYITDDSIRTFTDCVIVYPAEKKEYSINVDYKISAADEEDAETIKAKVEEAVEEYEKHLKSKMGIAINPEELRRYLYNAGAASVNIISPGSREKTMGTEVAVCIEKTVVYGGILE